MRQFGSLICATALLALALAGCSEDDAQAGPASGALGSPAAIPAAGGLNDSVISVRGDVISSTPSGFLLDYGSGRMMVEMDDWDWFQEGRAINAGDEVFVTGRLDRDVLERQKIEAISVYAVNLGVYFYASGSDEEDFGRSLAPLVPLGTSDIVGNVRSIEGREITVGHEDTTLRVDTAQMTDNPLDDQGNLRIRVGDRVYAWGRLDVDDGEAGELMAQGVVALRADRTKSRQPASTNTSTSMNASTNAITNST